MSFKVGDRVEYLASNDDGNPKHNGRTATITHVGMNRPDFVDINWDEPLYGDTRYLACVDNLKHIKDEPEYEIILDEAKRLVYGDRNKDYGHPHEDYTKNAAFLTTILGGKLKEDAVITPQDVILFMITLKVSRLLNDHTKRDSIVDVAGYAECLSRVNRRDAGLE